MLLSPVQQTAFKLFNHLALDDSTLFKVIDFFTGRLVTHTEKSFVGYLEGVGRWVSNPTSNIYLLSAGRRSGKSQLAMNQAIVEHYCGNSVLVCTGNLAMFRSFSDELKRSDPKVDIPVITPHPGSIKKIRGHSYDVVIFDDMGDPSFFYAAAPLLQGSKKYMYGSSHTDFHTGLRAMGAHTLCLNSWEMNPTVKMSEFDYFYRTMGSSKFRDEFCGILA
jgi:hypothetical protein